MPEVLIGSPAARAVHGWSAGARLVWTATPDVAGTTGRNTPVRTRESFADFGLEAPSPDPAGVAAELRRLADVAAEAHPSDGCTGALVVAADDLDLSVPALLDVLDRPGDENRVLVAEPRGLGGAPLSAAARIGPDASCLEAVSVPARPTTRPNRVVVGVLRIRAGDRHRAAELWRQAATLDWGSTDPFQAAVAVLVHGGLGLRPVDVAHHAWARTIAGGAGAPGSVWQQHLRSASRGGDGPFSTLLVRPISRRMTGVALRFNLSPNVITLISLLIGIGTALLVWTGHPVAWVAAAITLQVALLVDCMDGEIARFTRRFSPLGAWLDGVGDRVKEYAVLAAVAIVAVRDGHSEGWLLAIIAMAVVTARHLEDYGYSDRIAAARRSRPELVDPSELVGAPVAPDDQLPADRTVAGNVRFWAKKLAHVPIAERYLILSVMLLTLHPLWVLYVAIAGSGFALVWTVGGRVARVVLRRDPTWRLVPLRGEALDDQLDLGVLARLGGRLVPGSFLPALALALIGWLGAIAALCLDRDLIAVALAVVAAVAVGVACRRPLRHRLGWLAPTLCWSVEAAVWSALLVRAPIGAAVFVLLAVVAYRRYDLIYSIRLNGAVPSAWSVALGLGAEGRILVATVLALVLPTSALSLALLITAGYLALVFAAESLRNWPAPRHRATRTG